MQRQYRWGIAGPGNIARRFGAALKSISPSCCYAVASTNYDRARRYAEDLGFEKIYDGYDAMFQDELVDIVYIAVPHSHHFELTKRALESGKHVVCEKPITVNEKQAKQLFALAAKNDVFLMEGIWTRFNPAVKRAQQMVRDGAIGEIRYLRCALGENQPFNAESRLFDPALAGGALLDLGIYPLTMLLLFLGPDWNSVQSQLYLGPTGVDEVDTMTYFYNDGVAAQLSCSIRCDLDNSLVLFGTKGKITLPNFAATERVLFEPAGGQLIVEDFPHECNGFEHEARAVMQAVDSGHRETSEVSQADTLLTMRMMDMLREREAFSYPFE